MLHPTIIFDVPMEEGKCRECGEPIDWARCVDEGGRTVRLPIDERGRNHFLCCKMGVSAWMKKRKKHSIRKKNRVNM